MESEDLLARFLDYADGVSGGVPRFDSPDILDNNPVLDDTSRRIVLLAPRATITAVDGESILTALGRRWQFPTAARPLIDTLLSLNEPTVAEVLAVNAEISKEQAAETLTTLLRAGVIALR